MWNIVPLLYSILCFISLSLFNLCDKLTWFPKLELYKRWQCTVFQIYLRMPISLQLHSYLGIFKSLTNLQPKVLIVSKTEYVLIHLLTFKCIISIFTYSPLGLFIIFLLFCAISFLYFYIPPGFLFYFQFNGISGHRKNTHSKQSLLIIYCMFSVTFLWNAYRTYWQCL